MMTWDEKALVMIERLKSDHLETGFEGDGYGFQFDKPIEGYHAPVYRYWLWDDGRVWKWLIRKEKWVEITSKRMVAVVQMAAWPEWQAVGPTVKYVEWS